jgi:tetratricopeptide (TPR) repeat protein
MEALAVALGQQLGAATTAGNAAMLPLFRDQLALFRRAYGDDHPRVANTLFNLGDVLAHLGRDREAVAALEQSVAIYRRFASETSIALNAPRAALGQAYVRVGRFADAVATLEPTLALDTGDQPAKQLALAEALWQTGGDRRRAIALAQKAGQLAAADPDQAALVGQAERWVRARSR